MLTHAFYLEFVLFFLLFYLVKIKKEHINELKVKIQFILKKPFNLSDIRHFLRKYILNTTFLFLMQAI